MNFLKQIILTILLCLVLQYFLPWWSLVIGALVSGYVFGESSGASFLAGFIAVGGLWLATALFIDIQTQSVLTDKVARLFPTGSKTMLLSLTVIVGGIPGGLGALTGTFLKQR